MQKDQLLKLTVPKLREEALKVETISGVTGMSKTELIHELAAHFGIVIDVEKKKRVDTSVLKKQQKALREEKEKIRPEADRKQLNILRKKIKKTKRQTRKAVI
ncbi:MAG: hypothetical protein P9M14_01695 [Candidatus Alcyoniella australis]|nr:hypothetical protein [Candidatus Alcyoniella australis]